MSLIVRNDYGAIAINNKVLIKLLSERLLNKSALVTMCNKKGKVIKEKAPFIGPDYSEAIELVETKAGIIVKIYLITKATTKISNFSDEIFDEVEKAFTDIRLEKPKEIVLIFKEIMSMQFEKKGIEVSRKNG